MSENNQPVDPPKVLTVSGDQNVALNPYQNYAIELVGVGSATLSLTGNFINVLKFNSNDQMIPDFLEVIDKIEIVGAYPRSAAGVMEYTGVDPFTRTDYTFNIYEKDGNTYLDVRTKNGNKPVTAVRFEGQSLDSSEIDVSFNNTITPAPETISTFHRITNAAKIAEMSAEVDARIGVIDAEPEQAQELSDSTLSANEKSELITFNKQLAELREAHDPHQQYNIVKQKEAERFAELSYPVQLHILSEEFPRTFDFTNIMSAISEQKPTTLSADHNLELQAFQGEMKPRLQEHRNFATIENQERIEAQDRLKDKYEGQEYLDKEGEIASQSFRKIAANFATFGQEYAEAFAALSPEVQDYLIAKEALLYANADMAKGVLERNKPEIEIIKEYIQSLSDSGDLQEKVAEIIATHKLAEYNEGVIHERDFIGKFEPDDVDDLVKALQANPAVKSIEVCDGEITVNGQSYNLPLQDDVVRGSYDAPPR